MKDTEAERDKAQVEMTEPGSIVSSLALGFPYESKKSSQRNYRIFVAP